MPQRAPASVRPRSNFFGPAWWDLFAAARGRELLIAFDRDEAGQTKAPKLAALLRAEGARARIAHPPEPYKDLGEWAAAEGAASLITEVEWT